MSALLRVALSLIADRPCQMNYLYLLVLHDLRVMYSRLPYLVCECSAYFFRLYDMRTDTGVVPLSGVPRHLAYAERVRQ
jgi:hypothetical protein